MVSAQVVVGLAVVVVALITHAHGHAGSCEDHTPRCRGWAAQGLCQTSQQFMLLNCPVSCRVCIDPECFDRSQRCNDLANRGHCVTQQKFMLSTCPHSCNNCKIGPTRTLPRRRSIANPNFECGRGPSPGGSRSVSGSTSGFNIGEGVVNLRTERGIIFPDDPLYTRIPISSSITSRTRPTVTVNPATHDDSTLPIMPGKAEMAVPKTGISVEDTFCGATPITNRFLITAAHCVLNPDRPVLTVRLGELDFSKDNEANSSPVDYEVEQIIVHPDYKHNTLERYNDVALIQTVQPITFNEFVFPYCLTADIPAPKTVVIGAGFGFVNATHRASRLQEAELEVVDTNICENKYVQGGQERQLRVIYPELLQGRDIMCASYPERSACRGDSGGPLFLTRNDRRYLVGIVGTGVSCRGSGASDLPGLYVRVADHIDFIDSVLYGNT